MAAVVALVATIALGVGVWASQPSVEDQLFARGVQAYEKGNSQTAIDCLTRALALRPQSTELLFARGKDEIRTAVHTLQNPVLKVRHGTILRETAKRLPFASPVDSCLRLPSRPYACAHF